MSCVANGLLDLSLVALVALRILSGEIESQAATVADARRAEEIAMNRYRTGLINLDFVYAQTTLLPNERIATQINEQRMVPLSFL